MNIFIYKVDQACKVYSVAAGSTINLICDVPGVSRHPACIAAKVITYTCDAAGVTTILISSPNAAIKGMSEFAIVKALEHSGKPALKVVANVYSKARAIWDLANEK